jgi:protein-disulfide isomerase
MNRIVSIAALALVLIVGAGFWLSQSRTAVTGTEIALPGAANAQESTQSDPVSVIEMVQGAADAPVEIIEYASYTCPHCARFYEEVHPQLKKDYIDTGKVKFIYREVYFDKYGMWASMIARCEPEKFFGITDLVYKGLNEWVRAGSDAAIAGELRKIGLLAGISNEQLDSCLSDEAQLRALVGWYQENATRDDINSTPSFLINGEKYSNMSYKDFSRILDEKLGE